MYKSIVVFGLLFSIISHGAILIEEDNSSWFGGSSSAGRILLEEPVAGSILFFREKKKVAVGLELLGSKGLAGAHVELNFEPEDSTLIGFGRGEGYDSIHFNWKHSWDGADYAPYTLLGLAHWYNFGPKTSPSQYDTNIVGQFLTSEEKKSGSFGLNLLTAGAGLEFYNLSGPNSGVSYFAQLLLLFEPSKKDSTATAGLGINYHF